ncbi:MAG: PTS lactose/cellobiose transporter subunit IIA [Lachnospiraceae bacterium]|jgi:PTS system cellobiose-specific IIA component|nr:PTS lactose/cellobiose transporter subunit IIA [Lachnospiraceae bacterium]
MAMSTEDIAMMLIVHSGDARTLAFQALNAAKEGKFEEAKKLLAESEAKALEAHHVQTSMLTAEANGDGPEVNILLVHSQDHLMTSMLAQELIKELIYLHETKADKQ